MGDIYVLFMPPLAVKLLRRGAKRTKQLLCWRYAAYGKPVVLIVVVVWVHIATVEIQIVGVVGIVRGRRPIVAVVATIVR